MKTKPSRLPKPPGVSAISNPISAVRLICDGAKFESIRGRLLVRPGSQDNWRYAASAAAIVATGQPYQMEMHQLSCWCDDIAVQPTSVRLDRAKGA